MNDPIASVGQGAAVSDSAPKWHEWRGSGSVLVVDDEEPVRVVVGRAVAKMGFTANCAADGARALSLFASDPAAYSLVLLDLKIPGMDGAEILARLRLIRTDVPVILMSGYGSQDALARLSGFKISGFLHKPFTLDQLASRMRAVLEP